MSSETAIQSTPPPDVVSADMTPPPVKRSIAAGYFMQAVNVAASLKVTVTLFALSIFLVLAGTLAQVGNGNWTVVDDYFRSALVWIPFQIFFKRSFLAVPGVFPYPGGWLLGALLLINLLAAHFGLTIKLIRTRASSQQFRAQMLKRSGILILHFGVVVMMVGELITGKYAIEGVITIPDAKASNYLESQRKVELAIVNPSDAATDDVVVVPGKRLRRAGLIQDAALPFDVEVHQYMVNSALVNAGPSNPATKGDGLGAMAVEKPEVSGADSEQPEDLASAYVTLKKKGSGESLGTFLVSRWLNLRPPQQVTVDGKTYDLELRRERTYKPYTIYLKKFTHDVYPGTEIPKDFASEIRLVDPGAGEEIEAKIWMNHPLRYAGETFYQHSVLGEDSGTVLQVVRNPGWLLPYVSCFLVALGMIVHFGIKLVQFLEQQMAKAKPVTPFGLWVPRLGGVVLGGMVLFLIALEALPQSAGAGRMRLDDFGRLPVLDGGRVKPIDTLARNQLMVISSRQTMRDDKQRAQPATKWMLDVLTSNPKLGGVEMFRNPAAIEAKVFRIESDQVLSLLSLQPRDGLRYSVAEFGDREKIARLSRHLEQARENAEANRASEFDGKVLEFAKHFRLYLDLEERKTIKLVPPASPEQKDWMTLPEAIRSGQMAGAIDPAVLSLVKLLIAYDTQNADGFNQALTDYDREVSSRLPLEAKTTSFEVFFNRFEPFYVCTVMYGIVGVLACVSFLMLCFRARDWAEPLRRTAFWLLVLTLVVHTFGLVARMYIQDRWFVMVTNLYSSAVFIGWGCVALGLLLEVIFPLGIGTLVASVLGLGTAIVAHNLAAGGDTLEMMRAVLDTNFWLATHVTCVTLGYTATFVAGFLALVFLGLGVGTKLLDSDLMKVLSWMIYGVICFATLLSFVGTVLGGIWADQSWGRFWGWDPKENGALMIVIWNVLILHARWAGLVKQRGMAVLAVGGNIVTAWSWFGVNMLGVGLHSYGFMNGAVFYLAAFMLANLAVMGVGMLPMHMWLSSTTMRNRGFLSDL